jgi:hypothetical protein
VACSCERGNELSSSMKDGSFLDQLNDYQILKKYSIPLTYFQIFRASYQLSELWLLSS